MNGALVIDYCGGPPPSYSRRTRNPIGLLEGKFPGLYRSRRGIGIGVGVPFGLRVGLGLGVGLGLDLTSGME